LIIQDLKFKNFISIQQSPTISFNKRIVGHFFVKYLCKSMKMKTKSSDKF